ncbi:alpha-amylase family glycosyl hydrolase [Parasphingorhabdus pacifica]
MTLPPGRTEWSLHTETPWWVGASVYRVDLRLFADSNLDGIGDLDGLRQRLGYLELLGIDALWLYSPFAGPLTDSHRGIELDPVLGERESFEHLVTEAHESGIRVTVDVSADPAVLDRSELQHVLESNLRFWLDCGVDGVRVSTTPGRGSPADGTVREVLRLIRPIVDQYPSRALGVLVDDEWFSRFTERPPDWDIGVDLRLGDTAFDADRLQGTIDQILHSTEAIGVQAVWTVSDREQRHPVVRFGGGPAGVARARALALIILALPGVVGIDNGEELALPGPDARGAEPVRSPMVWEGDEPPFGFSAGPGSWWPIGEQWAGLTVEAQLEDPDSTLTLYRRALEIRRQQPGLADDRIEWFGAPPGCFAFRLAESGLTCALNTSVDPVTPPPGDVVLASGPMPEGQLLPNCAVWLT